MSSDCRADGVGCLTPFICDILRQGVRVSGIVRGMSMFPLFWPREGIVLRPLAPDGVIEVGSVVAAFRGDDKSLVSHRVIGFDGGCVVTRGDSVLHPDKPWRREDVVAVVESVEGRLTGRKMMLADDGGLYGRIVMDCAPVSYAVNNLMARVAFGANSLIKSIFSGRRSR